ncbi:hypothetical protein MSAN_00830300 [Mycena sanguinolenta]|uniref:Uncharacterized protein n=1 Tax=Mycena sanguinolenta TaxID=230812 RepID=A0A8H6YZJ9_9AGAR|nr:hypothetical protein MSAN_00830300 [Mycena sanguinolenta]
MRLGQTNGDENTTAPSSLAKSSVGAKGWEADVTNVRTHLQHDDSHPVSAPASSSEGGPVELGMMGNIPRTAASVTAKDSPPEEYGTGLSTSAHQVHDVYLNALANGQRDSSTNDRTHRVRDLANSSEGLGRNIPSPESPSYVCGFRQSSLETRVDLMVVNGASLPRAAHAAANGPPRATEHGSQNESLRNEAKYPAHSQGTAAPTVNARALHAPEIPRALPSPALQTCTPTSRMVEFGGEKAGMVLAPHEQGSPQHKIERTLKKLDLTLRCSKHSLGRKRLDKGQRGQERFKTVPSNARARPMAVASYK